MIPPTPLGPRLTEPYQMELLRSIVMMHDGQPAHEDEDRLKNHQRIIGY